MDLIVFERTVSLPMRLTHVFSPAAARAGSNLARAQATSFEAIRRAWLYTQAVRPDIQVDFVTPVHDADRAAVPALASLAPRLARRLENVTSIRPVRGLPLMGDVFQVGAAAARGEFIIYTNVDIAPMPSFYEIVARLLQDHPGFAIARRILTSEPMEAGELAQMYAQLGRRSFGLDTFVCPREVALTIDLGHVAVGLPCVEFAAMGAIDAACGFRAQIYRYLHANFHHGVDRVWKKDEALCDWNREQARRVLDDLVAAHAPVPPRSVLATVHHYAHDRRPPKRRLVERLMLSLGLQRRYPEPFDVTPDPLEGRGRGRELLNEVTGEGVV